MLKRGAAELRKVSTGEDVTFHTLVVKTNANVDAFGDPINSEEDVTRTDATVTVKYVRVILGQQNIVKNIGGDFQDADAVLDMDSSYQATVDDTKLSKGYVTHSGINYDITRIQPLTTGGTVTRLRVGLKRNEV